MINRVQRYYGRWLPTIWRPPALAVVVSLLAPIAVWAEPSTDRRPINAVVTIEPLRYWLDRIALKEVKAQTILPPGSTPELFEPTMGSRKAIEEAELVVLLGSERLVLESAVARVVKEMNKRPLVVALWPESEKEPEDVHLWLSPTIIRAFIPRLVTACSTLRPELRAFFEENGLREITHIAEIEQDVRDTLRKAPSPYFLVYHPSWATFASAFGLQQLSVESESHEPSPAKLTETIKAAREHKLSNIITQPQMGTEGAELVASELGGTVLIIDPLAYDWPKTLRESARAIAGVIPATPTSGPLLTGKGSTGKNTR